jgi:hypothetical protein
MSSSLLRALRGALLVGAPFALSDCLLVGESSCPDDGVDPPAAEAVSIEPSVASGGPLDWTQCDQACATVGDGLVTCVRESASVVLCFKQPYPCEGRRPAGLKEGARAGRNGFELHLSDAAWLEAASVDAFRCLRRELRAHGAPRRLLRAASRSRRDERRHARATVALARRFGVVVPPVQRERVPTRDIEALALENAVEGCVRETWGALVALRQASRASEPTVRAAMARIAPDEVRHAELAFRVDAWLCRRLSAEQRARVRQARAAAVAQLAHDVRQQLPRAERERLGLPGAREALQMLSELDRTLSLSSGHGHR